MKVFEWCYTLDNMVQEARPLNEEEKKGYNPDWAESLLCAVGDGVALPYVSSNDIPHEWWKTRKIWQFNGFGNQAVEISDAEWDWLIQLNARREDEKKEKERQNDIRYYQSVIAQAEKQRDIPSPEEAARRRKLWNDVNNEGGEGYIPTIINTVQYESAKEQLVKLLGDGIA